MRVASKLIGQWLAVTITASIIAVLDGGYLARWTALAPQKIWHGQVWRLVTWVSSSTGRWGSS